MDTPTLLFDRYRRRGDLDALGRAFDLLSPRLLALALHLTGNAADAEDALQATFVVAMQKASGFDPQKEVGPWLAGVLAGEANNLRRREQRRRTEALEEALVGAGAGDVVGDAERRELVAQLRTRIDALPDEQRQVLLLQLQHGLRPAEIAEVLGIAPGTVRMRLHRGLDALRKALPAGLLALLVAGTARRGLAAVREAVLQAGAQSALVAGGGVAAATIGGVMLKKVLMAVGLLAAGLWLWRSVSPPDSGVKPTAAPSGVIAASGEFGARDAAPIDETPAATVQREAATPVPTPTADEPASLVVTVRTWGPFAEDPLGIGVEVPEEPGTPGLPGIVVELGPDGTNLPRKYDPRVQRVVADRDGRCSFEGLAPGSYLVEVEGAGAYARERVQLAAGEVAEVGLLVDVVGIARGRVVDPDGRPVPGAELWIGDRFDSYTWPQKQVRAAAIADADGRFAAPFRKTERFLVARRAGYTASRSRALQQLGDGEVVLVLGRDPATLNGVLVDEIGQLVAGAIVSIDPADATFREPRRDVDGALLGPLLGMVARSDEHGCFVFEGLGADLWSLRCRHAGHAIAEQRLRLAAGEQRVLRVTMARRAMVRGRVLRPDGRPCDGVFVSVTYDDGGSHPTVTDERGEFCFTGVALRPYELAAGRSSGGQPVRRAMPAPPPEGVEVELVYDEAPSLFGTVRAANGRRLGGWFVGIGQGEAERREPIDAEGRFRIDDVEAGEHTLRVHRLAEQSASPVWSGRVTADVGVDVKVPLEAMPFGEIAGRVVGPDGQRLREWVVDLPFTGSKQGSVQHDGTFRFSQLLPGTHWLRVVAPDCVVHLQAVQVDEREVVDVGLVTLVRAASLRVRYVMADGTPWRGRPPMPHLRDGKGEFRTTPDQIRYRVDGDEVVVIGVAPGAYTILGAPGDELLTAPTEVVLAAGQERSVTVTLTLGRRRTFRIAELEGLADADGCVQVVLRGADGGVLAEDRHRLQDGAAIAAFIVPVGRATIEARAGERIVARLAFEVGPELVDAPRLDVPRVR